MLVRKYTGKNLSDALRQVKADLGEHATILSSRSVPGGLFRSHMEITATLSAGGLPAAPAAPRSAAPSSPPDRVAPKEPGAQERPAATAAQMDQVARFLSPVRMELRALQRQVRSISDARPAAEAMERALEDLRQLMEARRGAAGEVDAPRSPRRRLARRLVEAGVRASLAQDLVEEARRRTRGETDGLEGATARVIAERLTCQDPLEASARTSARPRAVALVGPPGVGKTTTLAKIATRAALLHDLRVALIDCDTAQLGATRPLAEIARVLDVPYRRADNGDALRAASAEFVRDNPMDLILIDTGGTSPRDAAAMVELQQLLSSGSAETLLLLNADMRPLEIDANLNGFAAVEPDALTFTKLDLAVGLGALYDATVTAALPVMYLTHGRRIPDDMEPATAERIASMVMGLHLN